MPDEQDDQTTDDQSSDQSTQEQSDQEPADSDQPSAQSDDAPADSDQSAEQSEEEQPTAETDQAVDQSEEQPGGESDQPAEQSEEQPADSDQPEEQPTEGEQTAAEAEEPPGDTDQAAEQSGEEPAEADGVAAQAGKQPADTTQTKQQPTGGAQPAGQAGQRTTQSPAPKRPYGVESWRPLVTEMAGDIPVEVLLRWIKHESGGNPCSTGAPAKTGGGSIENGIFQLYSPDDDHLATPAQLHGSFCSGQTCTRDLTLEEARIQVASGIAYVRSCRERARAQLKQAGVTWDEAGRDFWALVKMQHNLPSIPKQYIPKLHPSSWSEFKAGVIKEQPKYSKTTIFSNAEDIGAAAV
jgi:hypothetical protein